jgi:UDP-N-acetylglucosamine 2-epimerase
LSIRFFNNYYADYLFTIGSLNKNTLRERKIPESNIYLSGPLLLDRYPAVQDKPEVPLRKKELIYITQAYLWHLDASGHNEQLDSIHGLLQSIAESQAGRFDICLRVHPRDDVRIYEEFLRNYSLPVRIDTSPAAEFLQGISRYKILISGLSTLAFEWIYLGGNCVFLSTEKLLKEGGEIYKRLGLSPYLKPGEILRDISAERIPNCSEQIDRIFYRHPSGNLKYTVETINAILADDRRK